MEDIINAKENGYSFNWACFFLDSIKWTPLNKKEKEKIVLLFGRIISLILESKGLVPSGHPSEKGTVYDKSNFSLMGIHVVETQEKKADGSTYFWQTWKWTDNQISKRRDTLKSLREQFGGEDSDDIDRVVEEGAAKFQQEGRIPTPPRTTFEHGETSSAPAPPSTSQAMLDQILALALRNEQAIQSLASTQTRIVTSLQSILSHLNLPDPFVDPIPLVSTPTTAAEDISLPVDTLLGEDRAISEGEPIVDTPIPDDSPVDYECF